MPVDPATLDFLVRAGGWTLFVATIVVIAVAGARRKWVFGWLYIQERRDRTKADSQAERTTKALRELTVVVREQNAEIAQFRAVIARVMAADDRDARHRADAPE